LAKRRFPLGAPEAVFQPIQGAARVVAEAVLRKWRREVFMGEKVGGQKSEVRGQRSE
jgi:hypothetical protein